MCVFTSIKYNRFPSCCTKVQNNKFVSDFPSVSYRFTPLTSHLQLKCLPPWGKSGLSPVHVSSGKGQELHKKSVPVKMPPPCQASLWLRTGRDGTRRDGTGRDRSIQYHLKVRQTQQLNLTLIVFFPSVEVFTESEAVAVSYWQLSVWADLSHCLTQGRLHKRRSYF